MVFQTGNSAFGLIGITSFNVRITSDKGQSIDWNIELNVFNGCDIGRLNLAVINLEEFDYQMYLDDLSGMVSQSTARHVDITNPFAISSANSNTGCFSYTLISCSDCAIAAIDATEAKLRATFWSNDITLIGTTGLLKV